MAPRSGTQHEIKSESRYIFTYLDGPQAHSRPLVDGRVRVVARLVSGVTAHALDTDSQPQPAFLSVGSHVRGAAAAHPLPQCEALGSGVVSIEFGRAGVARYSIALVGDGEQQPTLLVHYLQVVRTWCVVLVVCCICGVLYE